MELLQRLRRQQRRRKSSKIKEASIEPYVPTRTSLLGLPLELRLAIFEYTLANTRPVVTYFGPHGDRHGQLEKACRAFSRWSRHDRPIYLLGVCHQFRQDTLKIYRERCLFVLATSVFEFVDQNESLRPVEEALSPPWALDRVRQLVLITSRLGPAWAECGFRISDLRCLQSMTSLRKLTIMFSMPGGIDIDASPEGYKAPVRAAVESIPLEARVHLAGPPSSNDKEDRDLLDTLYRAVSNTKQLYHEAVRQECGNGQSFADSIRHRQGLLSGSTVDHSFCAFQQCQDGRGCMNSEVELSSRKEPKGLRAGVPKLDHLVACVGSLWRRIDITSL